jgi:hypothetical protein
MGRTAAYEAVKAGTLPVPVVRVGRRLVVTRSSIVAALGISTPSLHHRSRYRRSTPSSASNNA